MSKQELNERFHQLKNAEHYLNEAIHYCNKAKQSGGLDHHSIEREKERLNDLVLITQAKLKHIMKVLRGEDE